MRSLLVRKSPSPSNSSRLTTGVLGTTSSTSTLAARRRSVPIRKSPVSSPSQRNCPSPSTSSTMVDLVPGQAATSRQPSEVLPTTAIPPTIPLHGRFSCFTNASLRTTISILPTTVCSSRAYGASISSIVRCPSQALSIFGADRKPMVMGSSLFSLNPNCGTTSPTTSA